MAFARELAERIAAIDHSALPEAAIYWGKVAVLDTIGVALAGTLEDAPRLLDETLGAPADGPSLVFGANRRASALDAALLNATAAHALDFDNTATNMGGHVSAVMVPTLIAAGDALDASGADLLLAHAVGYETGRIGYALNPEHTEKGWHPTATIGVFAVTAACARLLGLTVDQIETALALSTSLAAGTKANFGTMAKPLHAGQCARGGLMSALLARKGFTANPNAFEDKQGFLNLFSEGRCDTQRVLEGWGMPFDIVSPGASYKLYPCCYSTHSAIEAARHLVGMHGCFEPAEIARVDTRTSARALAHTDRPQPSTALEAKFSVQYCVARALLHGEVVLEHFDRTAPLDPRVQSLMGKVHASPYHGPFFSDEDRFDARLTLTLNDGRVLEAKVDRPLGGTAANPIPEKDLDAKFRNCASRILTRDAIEAVRQKIWALDAITSVRELTRALETTRDVEAEGDHQEIGVTVDG